MTPVALYGKSSDFDYQFQFSVWTPSGEFKPGGPNNRGSGFWSLIYSRGGVWYPGGDRQDWSVSAVARIEQNFEQAHTGITPGDNFDIDWGIGKIVEVGAHAFDVGVSGFGTWQITHNRAARAPAATAITAPAPRSARASPRDGPPVRAQWEFGTQNAVQGNNIWLIVNKQF